MSISVCNFKSKNHFMNKENSAHCVPCENITIHRCFNCFYLTLKRPPGVRYDPSLRFLFNKFFGVSYNDINLRDFVTTGVL